MSIRLVAASTGALAVLVSTVIGPSSVAQAEPGSLTGSTAGSGAALTPTTASTVYDQIYPVTGSDNVLVYERAPSLAAGINRYPASRTNPNTTTLVARSASGHQVILTAPPADADVVLWSLAGSTLTAATIDGGESLTGSVYWWNIDTAAHGHFMLSDGEVYEAAAPDGVVVLRGNELRRHTLGGTETSLGTPPGAELASVTTDATGLVLTSVAGGIRYESFATPGSYRTLHSGSTHAVLCTGFSVTAAACYVSYEKQDFGWAPGPVRIVPLDGDAPTVLAPNSIPCSRYPTIAGPRLYVGGGCSDQNAQYTAALGSTAVTEIETSIVGTVSALGRAIGSVHNRALVALTPTGNGSVVVRARRSPITADQYALAPGRIVYTDDQPDPAHLTARAGIHTRTVSTDGSSLTIGPAHRIDLGAAADDLYPDVVAASGTTTVYATPSTASEYFTLTLTVVGPGGHRVVTGLPEALSGNRLVYEPPPGAATGSHDIVLDTATWTQTVIDASNNGAFTVWGDYLVWADTHGGIYREDLTTGAKTTLAAGNPATYVETYVYAYGDWVGWQSRTQDGTFTDVIRDARTMAAPITLSDTLWSLSSAGALLTSTGHPQGEPDTQQWAGSIGLLGTTTPIKLLGYDGHESTLLPAQSFVGGPQLSGRTLVWSDSHGTLHAKHLPGVPVPAPQSLGAALVTSSTIMPGSTSPWIASVPYSQQLQSCQITFTRGGVIARVLPCAVGARRRGVATFEWNGTDRSGAPMPAGTYTFQITGHGAGGAALDGGGDHVPVAGTLTLS